jgi:hypothetical protein
MQTVEEVLCKEIPGKLHILKYRKILKIRVILQVPQVGERT